MHCWAMVHSDEATRSSEVIEMLECGTDGLHMPCRPFFCDDHIVDTDSHHFSSELNAIEEEDD